MAKICGKWRIYLGIGLNVWETAKLFGKWRRSVGNVSNMSGNNLNICQTSEICGKWLRDLGNGQNIWEKAWMHGARLKYLRNGLNILEMA